MSNLSAEEFLNKKIKILFEPVISSILVEKPKNPVKFHNKDSFYD